MDIRVGQLVEGIVIMSTAVVVAVEFDGRTAVLPHDRMLPGDQLKQGDRVRCLVEDENEIGSKREFVVGRRHPDFIEELMKAEIPEVAEGIVDVMRIVRVPGYRTMVAVRSDDPDVDAVAVLWGHNASQIDQIQEEFHGERIEFVQWHGSPEIFIRNALSLTATVDIHLSPALSLATIVADESDISDIVSMGYSGLGLVSELTGWKICLMTPDSLSQHIRYFHTDAVLGKTTIEKLVQNGILSAWHMATLNARDLAKIIGTSVNIAEVLLDNAQQFSSSNEADFIPEELDSDSGRFLGLHATYTESLLNGTNPKPLLAVSADVGEFADEEDVADLIVRLYTELNRYHIAAGGNGLSIDEWLQLVPAHDAAGAPR